MISSGNSGKNMYIKPRRKNKSYKNKPTRLAYIISMVHGMEAFVHREIAALKKRGLNITIFITKYTKDEIYGPEKAGWEFYKPVYHKIPLQLVISFLKDPVRFLQLLNTAIKTSSIADFALGIYYSHIMKKIQISKIHCHFGDHKLFVGFYCKKMLSIPLSVTVHAHELCANPNEKMFRTALKECDNIITIANLNKRELIEQYGVPEEKIHVLRLFVDTNKYKKTDIKRILSVGRFKAITTKCAVPPLST